MSVHTHAYGWWMCSCTLMDDLGNTAGSWCGHPSVVPQWGHDIHSWQITRVMHQRCWPGSQRGCWASTLCYRRRGSGQMTPQFTPTTLCQSNVHLLCIRTLPLCWVWRVAPRFLCFDWSPCTIASRSPPKPSLSYRRRSLNTPPSCVMRWYTSVPGDIPFWLWSYLNVFSNCVQFFTPLQSQSFPALKSNYFICPYLK